MRILSVFGTRPEGIKMAPLVSALRDTAGIESRVCITSQHKEMLSQVLEIFEIATDYDLNVMRHAQNLHDVTCGVLQGMPKVFADWRPDWVLVQGDTTTTMATALAAFYDRIAVGHVEAGLRTGNIYSPFPEEVNRRLASVVATAHFAPTHRSRENLLAEGVDPERVIVTGNTVIDALLHIRDRLESTPALAQDADAKLPPLDPSRRTVMVTGHRRENFGDGLAQVCDGLRALADRDDVEVVYPVHLNPNVKGPVMERLGGHQRIHLLEPLDYISFVRLMSRCSLIITDSGGIQEEAPVLGKPVLVTRDTTERGEAVESGVAKLVGPDRTRIVAEASRLLDDRTAYEAMSRAGSPFGDGAASRRIIDYLLTAASGGSSRERKSG